MLNTHKIIVFIGFLLFSTTILAAEQIVIIQDREINNLIKSAMDPLLQAAGVDEESLEIYIVQNNTPNAFVFGGSRIFIHTGLISFADTIDEVAGVLAHELGHITAGHLSRQQQVLNDVTLLAAAGLLGSILLLPLGLGSEALLFTLLTPTQLAINSFLTYSRAEESQADQIAVQYIESTDYSLRGLNDFFTKMHGMEDKSIYDTPITAWAQTHPLLLDRISFLQNSIKNSQYNTRLKDRFNMVKAKIKAFTRNYSSTMMEYDENTPEKYYAWAIAEYRINNYKKALIYTQQALAFDPDNIYIKELIGDIYFSSGDLSNAIKWYLKSVGSHLTGSIAFKLASVYLHDSSFENADKYINISLQIDSNNPKAWMTKSIIKGKLHDDINADIALSEYFLLFGDHKQALSLAIRASNKAKSGSKEWLKAQDIIKLVGK